MSAPSAAPPRRCRAGRRPGSTPTVDPDRSFAPRCGSRHVVLREPRVVACDFVIGDTMSPGDEVAHYGFQVSARPLRLWKALAGCYAPVRRLWEAPGADNRRGSSPMRRPQRARLREPQHRSTNAGSGTRLRGGRDDRNRRRPGQSATTKHPSSATIRHGRGGTIGIPVPLPSTLGYRQMEHHLSHRRLAASYAKS